MKNQAVQIPQIQMNKSDEENNQISSTTIIHYFVNNIGHVEYNFLLENSSFIVYCVVF